MKVVADMAALDEVFERAHPLSFPHLLHPKLLPFLLLLLQPHFVLLFYLLGLGPLLLLQGEPQSEVYLRQLVEDEHLRSLFDLAGTAHVRVPTSIQRARRPPRSLAGIRGPATSSERTPPTGYGTFRYGCCCCMIC